MFGQMNQMMEASATRVLASAVVDDCTQNLLGGLGHDLYFTVVLPFSWEYLYNPLDSHIFQRG